MFERGSIVLIAFPFSDLSRAKQRPVLIIAPPDRNGDFICLALTSQPHQQPALEIAAESVLGPPLPKRSWVRTDKVFGLAATLVLREMTSVGPDVVAAAVESLCASVWRQPLAR